MAFLVSLFTVRVGKHFQWANLLQLQALNSSNTRSSYQDIDWFFM